MFKNGALYKCFAELNSFDLCCACVSSQDSLHDCAEVIGLNLSTVYGSSIIFFC